MSSFTLLALGVSAVCGLLLGVAIFVLLGREQSVAERVSAYVTLRAEDPESNKSLIERALGDRQARKIAKSPLFTRIRTELEVAEVKLSVEQLALVVTLATVAIGWLLVSSTGSPVAGALALAVPFGAQLVVKVLAGRQRRRFAEQLPDNLQVVASAMRSGQTFVGALKAVLEDAPEPSQRELRRAVLDEQLGIPLPDALHQVTARMRSEDFHHVAVVASLQRETGGNTAEVIELVADTVRERIEIRRMVRGLTAQGRLSGSVLSLLPVGLLMMISVVNPHYVHPLFHSTPGLLALGAALLMVIGGALVIRKIIEIKV